MSKQLRNNDMNHTTHDARRTTHRRKCTPRLTWGSVSSVRLQLLWLVNRGECGAGPCSHRYEWDFSKTYKDNISNISKDVFSIRYKTSIPEVGLSDPPKQPNQLEIN